MANRINSSLIFELLNHVYNATNAKIYDLLLFSIDNDHAVAGPRFRDGHNPKSQTCFWPSKTWGDKLYYQYSHSQTNINPDYLKAGQLIEQEIYRTLPSSLGLETALGVWCYDVLLKAFTTGRYENNPTAAKIAILAVSRNYGMSKQKLNYYSKFTVSIEKTLCDIVRECENSSGKGFVEDDEITSTLILHDIRAFLEGLTTEKDIIFKSFQSNEEFVQYLLPRNCIDDFTSMGITCDAVVECGYDDEYVKRIGDKFFHDNFYRTRQVVANCKRIYEDINYAEFLYDGCLTTLTSHITNARTKELIISCIRRCTNGSYPYRGLAVLVLLALLGEAQFKRLFPDATSAHAKIHE